MDTEQCSQGVLGRYFAFVLAIISILLIMLIPQFNGISYGNTVLIAVISVVCGLIAVADIRLALNPGALLLVWIITGLVGSGIISGLCTTILYICCVASTALFIGGYMDNIAIAECEDRQRTDRRRHRRRRKHGRYHKYPR